METVVMDVEETENEVSSVVASLKVLTFLSATKNLKITIRSKIKHYTGS